MQEFTATLNSDPFAVRDVIAHLLAHPCLCALSSDVRNTVELVLAEALNNIVEHAFAHSTGVIHLTMRPSVDHICCAISDKGISMPDSTAPDGGFPNPDQNSFPAEGGYGWYLIRTLTRDLTYQRAENENILSFTIPSKQSARV